MIFGKTVTSQINHTFLKSYLIKNPFHRFFFAKFLHITKFNITETRRRWQSGYFFHKSIMLLDDTLVWFLLQYYYYVFSRLQLQKSGHLWFMCILLTFILLLLLYVFHTKNTIISSCIIQCNIQDTYLIFSSFHNMCTRKRQVFFKKKPFENGFAHCLGSNGKSKY